MAAFEQHMHWVLATEKQMQAQSKHIIEHVQNTWLIFEKAINRLMVEFEQRSASQVERNAHLAATDAAALSRSNKRPAPSNSQERPSSL
jgi:hypothetical protein